MSHCPQTMCFPLTPSHMALGLFCSEKSPWLSQLLPRAPSPGPVGKGRQWCWATCGYLLWVGGSECVELQRRVFPTWKGGSLGVFACCWQAPCPVE